MSCRDTSPHGKPKTASVVLTQILGIHCWVFIVCSLGLEKIIKKEEMLLKEYCTRLISDVVTGKVDVQKIKVPEIDVEVKGVDNDG